MLRLAGQRGHRQGRPVRATPLIAESPAGADRADPARVRGAPRRARARSGIAAAAPHPRPSPTCSRPGSPSSSAGSTPAASRTRPSAHFANPRNDFWRLLHAAGFTPRLLDPSEQFDLLPLGIGVTNAAYRTTPGSGDLRAGDFAGSAERLEALARELRPGVIAFVGKEAYRGAVPRAPRARPPGAPARRDGALRAAVDLAGERRRSLGGAAALVREPCASSSAPARERAPHPPRRPRGRARPGRPDPARPLRVPGADALGDAGRRDRAGREARGRDPARAGGGDGA